MNNCKDLGEGTSENEACFSVKVDKKPQHHAIELMPLNEFASKYGRQNSVQLKSTWRGPLKTLRLLLLVALLPTLFIVVPLYLRYHVFSGQIYPVSMSDMRLIDKKVSTTWCQRQILRSNATFNAFLLSSKPKLADKPVPVTMTRHLYLEDDMKEYWGFYLLKGSVVTVSSCVRWPGASLIMIRGHKHLKECAYIGDDSSEELDEILKANDKNFNNEKSSGDSPTNKPEKMIRQLGEILFHQPRPTNKNDHDRGNHQKSKPINGGVLSEEKDHMDPKILRSILGELRSKQYKNKTRSSHKKHEHIVAVPQLTNRYRDTNVNEDEERWLSFKDLEPHKENVNMEDNYETENKNKQKEKATERDQIDNENQLTSSEIFEDILDKLKKLGNKSKTILNRLQEKLINHTESEYENDQNITQSSMDEYPKVNESDTNISKEKDKNLSKEEVAEINLDTLKQLLVEVLKEQKLQKKYSSQDQRNRRDIVINPLIAELNEHDEEGNLAKEQFEPDGYADHHSIINETTFNDMSQSEFWSSFSSSEEALLECEGLILNLPLTPHKECQKTSSDDVHEKASLSNTITYNVPMNGYYFFVFNSENEIQTNYIRVKFDIQKTIYNLTTDTVTECKNSTGSCTIPLSFFSGEKVVLELPLRDNDSLWNEEFVVMSECEPRTSIYLVCVIFVQLLVIFMAFQ